MRHPAHIQTDVRVYRVEDDTGLWVGAVRAKIEGKIKPQDGCPMKRILLILALPVLLSCTGSEEADNLALAQKCLDEVKQSNPTSASKCLSYVKDYDSQQANILKCSIYMTSGGLVEDKIVNAADALEDSSITNKEAAYMSVLALDMGQTPGDYTAGYTRSVLADKYCQLSGVPGLRYISGVIVAGTYMARSIEALGGSIDINDPASIQTAVNDMITKCTDAAGNTGDPNYAACFPSDADTAVLGSTVETLAESYCSSAPEDDEVCQHLTSAVDAAGSDPEDIGRALLCYLSSPPRGYDPGTDQCQ